MENPGLANYLGSTRKAAKKGITTPRILKYYNLLTEILIIDELLMVKSPLKI